MNEFDAMDLDGLDIDGLDDSLIDGMDLNDFGAIETTVDFPHLKMNTKEFKEILKIGKSVIATSTKDIISRSICLVREGDKVKALATDFDVFYEGTIDLINTENILQESIAFPVDVMIKLIKAVPSNIVIFKDEEGFKLKLAGGDVPLEVHSIDAEKYRCGDTFVKDAKSMNAGELGNIIRDFSPLVFGAVSPQERRIILGNDSIATYMFSGIIAKGDYPKMDLKIKDINIIKQLVTNPEEELVFHDSNGAKVPRKVIEGERFKYTFLVSDMPANEGMLQGIAQLDFDSGVYIDFLQVYKLIELSSELNYSLGKVGLNVDDTGSIKLAFKTKKGKDSIFTIDGTIEGNVKPLKTELEVQSKLLKVLLRCFTKESSIKVNVTDDALTISTDNYNSVLFIANR